MENMTSAINVQVDAKDKELATNILKNLGLNMSTYINMAIKQLINKDGVPFDITLPKEENDLLQYFTKEELKETAKELAYMKKHPEEYPSYNNWKDLEKALLSDE